MKKYWFCLSALLDAGRLAAAAGGGWMASVCYWRRFIAGRVTRNRRNIQAVRRAEAWMPMRTSSMPCRPDGIRRKAMNISVTTDGRPGGRAARQPSVSHARRIVEEQHSEYCPTAQPSLATIAGRDYCVSNSRVGCNTAACWHFSSFHELMQSCDDHRPSVRLFVCPSVCTVCKHFAQIASSTRQMAGSPPVSHVMVPRRACIQDVLKIKVEVKGHVIRALLWCHEMFAIQYGLTFCLYMRSLYEAPLHSPIVSFQYKYQAARSNV